VTLTDEFMLCTKLINKSERASNKAVMTLQTDRCGFWFVRLTSILRLPQRLGIQHAINFCWEPAAESCFGKNKWCSFTGV